MGATRAVDPTKASLADTQRELGMTEGFDVALEMSGSPAAMKDILANTIHGARIALLGIPSELHDRLRVWNATTSVSGAVELADAHPPHVMREMYDTLAELVEACGFELPLELVPRDARLEESVADRAPLSPERRIDHMLDVLKSGGT